MKPKFSGHETFPLRYGWLHKGVNLLINKDKDQSIDDAIQDAIVTLGVGKNMVSAVKYWSELSDVIEPDQTGTRGGYKPTELGKFLFLTGSERGNADPYLEKIGSIWLLHYHMNRHFECLTAYRYFFNYCNFQAFEKTRLTDELYASCQSLTGHEAGKKATVKKDVDCFLSTYTKRLKAVRQVDEDHFTSPMAELGLIVETSSHHYVSDLGERSSLPSQIFAFALCDFIQRETKDSGATTIDFDSLLSKPGSPGRIFRLSEQGLTQKLDEASLLRADSIKWTDSLGLRQIQISNEVKADPGVFIDMYYGGSHAF